MIICYFPGQQRDNPGELDDNLLTLRVNREITQVYWMIICVILFVHITLRLIANFMRDYPGNCIVIICVPVLHLLRQHHPLGH
jgi:hypothetical protein